MVLVLETRGRSLEGMDDLFELPWHQIGRHEAEPSAHSGVLAEKILERAASLVAQLFLQLYRLWLH